MPEKEPPEETSNITSLHEYNSTFRIRGFFPRTLIGGSLGVTYGLASVEGSFLVADLANRFYGEPLTPEQMLQMKGHIYTEGRQFIFASGLLCATLSGFLPQVTKAFVWATTQTLKEIPKLFKRS